MVAGELIAFLHEDASVFPCWPTGELQLRTVRQFGFRGAPDSVRAVLRHRRLPNVQRQDATGARESCEGLEGIRSLAIGQQIVEHAPSHYGIKRTGEGWYA